MSNNNQNGDRQRLGGLWKRESQNTGTKYLTGKITVDGQDISLVVFATKEKKNEKSPDYVVYLGQDRPAAQGNAAPPQRSAPPQRNNAPQRRPQQNSAPQPASEPDFI
jgi:hypothetical protein